VRLGVWEEISICNSCALNLSDSFNYCMNALDCLNRGGNVIELVDDTVGIACQTGTCQPSIDGSIPCGKNLLPCPSGTTCSPLEETCYTREFCNADLELCFEPTAPAGSSNACSIAIEGTVVGTGKNRVKIPNNCAILPKAPSNDCSQLNQGEECCGSDVEESCDACEHGLCKTGSGLALYCDPCVTAVCFGHPECCDTDTGEWNITCISEAITICGISCNEIGWANLQWPPAMTHTISAINRTDNAYGQVWIDGVTNQPGPTPGLRAN
jgi:hypothetical protein